jgi:hypothetical protein
MDPNSLLPRHEIERYFSLENPRDKIAAECSRAPLDAEVRIPLFLLLWKTLNLPILVPELYPRIASIAESWVGALVARVHNIVDLGLIPNS